VGAQGPPKPQKKETCTKRGLKSQKSHLFKGKALDKKRKRRVTNFWEKNIPNQGKKSNEPPKGLKEIGKKGREAKSEFQKRSG